MEFLAIIVLLAAGIALVATFIINSVNNWLLHCGWSFVEPDWMIGEILHAKALHREKEGLLTQLVATWVATLGFLCLYFLPVIKTIPLFAAALLYCLCLWLCLMFILLPLTHRGLFGTLHHRYAGRSTALLFFVYAMVLSFCTALIV